MRFGWISLVGVTVAVLLAASQMRESQRRDSTQTHRAHAAPLVVGGPRRSEALERRTPSDGRRPLVHRAPSAASKAAARFLRAFVAYEVGRATRDEMRALRETSSPRLWRELNSGRGEPAPVRLIGEASVVGLSVGAAPRRRLVALLATLRRRTGRSRLVVVLHRAGARWQVVRVGHEVHVIPPEQLRTIFTRGPDVRWAA